MESPALAAAHLQTHAMGHRVSDKPKVEPVKRPSISTSGTNQDWLYFQSRWDDYTAATGISESAKAIQLLECCDPELRRSVQRGNGGVALSLRPVDEVMAAIKLLAVRLECHVVARDKLRHMTQDREESVRAFYARLQGQAGTCGYLWPCRGCGDMTDYTEPMIADTLVTGLADQEIKQSIYGKASKARSLAQTIVYVESKEGAKISLSSLATGTSIGAVKQSSYRQASRPSTPPHPIRQGRPTRQDRESPDDRCDYCGKTGHGRHANLSTRRTSCSAYGQTCGTCGKRDHLGRVCKSGRTAPPRNSGTESENAIFEGCCTITSPPGALAHHAYNPSSQQWVQRRSLPQPTRIVAVRTLPEDHANLRLSRRPPPARCTTDAMVDTGCQSCLAGTFLLRRLGLTNTDLIPVSLTMKAANMSGINILGALLLEISLRNATRTSKQMVYITASVNKLFLSRETCTGLGIIPSDFPDHVSAVALALSQAAPKQSYASKARPTHGTPTARPTPGKSDARPTHGTDPSEAPPTCGCPRRTLPPLGPLPLPAPATEGNRGLLEQHLRDCFRSSTFNTCTHQALPMMAGPRLRLNIDPAAHPVAIHKASSIPIHWEARVKADLDRDVRLGVLEKVPVGTPDTWCHRMVIVGKANGEPRRVVDFQPLNLHATRETHHTKSPYHQARAVPKGVKKSVFDAWNGYHSVPLHPDDSHFTTFLTPWGRYRYLTAPQGYKASGDGYTARFDALLADIPNFTKCIDDALLWSPDIAQAFDAAVQWLQLCGNNGITLNPAKFAFALDTVQFAGFEIGPHTVKPATKFTRAITEFPTPTSSTDVRSWFGLVNQVAYTFSHADIMAPFRALLKPSAGPFAWSDDLQSAFEASKLQIVSAIGRGVEIFDKHRTTCLATDWSKSGIGFWLFQRHCSCPRRELFCCKTGWRITLVGSRFTHAAESRYAAIEGEALAVAEALNKCRHFILGCSDLFVAVDHKPLLKIFGDRSLADISNARLRNLKEKTLPFSFSMVHIPGVRNCTSDALSRHPSGSTSPDGLHLPDPVSAPPPRIPIALMAGLSIDTDDATGTAAESDLVASFDASLTQHQPISWQALKEATTSDESLQLLLTHIEEGFPEKPAALPPAIRPFHLHRSYLYTVDGVAVYKDRLIIPSALQKSCLAHLHSAHQGTTMMLAKAESSIFWPGISADIAAHRESCSTCNTMAPSQASQPPFPPVLPTRPFQSICADYFHHRGHFYMVIVDRFSGWPIVERSRNGAGGIICVLRGIFVTFGIPEDITTDGGPEFTASSTKRFLLDWGVHHRICSVAFPHSNSRAEIGVKTVKRALADHIPADGSLDTDGFQRAMLAYRNCPDPITKVSPAMAVFARPIREMVPVLPGKLRLHPYWDSLLDDRERALTIRGDRELAKWSLHTRPLPALSVGDPVRIQNQTGQFPRRWEKTGIVVEVKQFNQYVVKMAGSGRVSLRNRKFLRRLTSPTTSPPTRIEHHPVAPDPPTAPTSPDSHPTDDSSWPDIDLPLPTQTPVKVPPSPTPLGPSPSPHPSPPRDISPPAEDAHTPTRPALRRSTRIRFCNPWKRPPDVPP